MSLTSLNAYAAWLAKHETKAVGKRRSLTGASERDTIESEWNAIEGDAANDLCEQQRPYSQWLYRKEMKLPSVKIVVQSPQSGAHEGGPLPQQHESNKNNSGQATRIVEQQNSPDTTDTRRFAAPGKRKREATSRFDGNPGTKNAKKQAIDISAAATHPSRRISHTQSSQTSEPSQLNADPLSCQSLSSSRSRLPVFNEARYWRDVDRFSFLA